MSLSLLALCAIAAHSGAAAPVADDEIKQPSDGLPDGLESLIPQDAFVFDAVKIRYTTDRSGLPEVASLLDTGVMLAFKAGRMTGADSVGSDPCAAPRKLAGSELLSVRDAISGGRPITATGVAQAARAVLCAVRSDPDAPRVTAVRTNLGLFSPGEAGDGRELVITVEVETYFQVGTFDFKFQPVNESLPTREEVLALPVTVVFGADGVVAPFPVNSQDPCGDLETFEGATATTVGALERLQVPLGRSAVAAVERAIFCEIRDRGIVAVQVWTPGDSLDAVSLTTEQTTPSGPVTIVVESGVVVEVRTIASGDRVVVDDRMNNPLHDRIRRLSPVQGPGVGGGQGGLIDRTMIEDYVLRLNRHPGRQIDVAIAPGEDVGEAILDYHIRESRPFRIYSQLSNTGTEATNEWRQRFGILHTQLRGRDDILSVEYSTAGFDATHLVTGSYQSPFRESDWLSWRVFGNYNEYTASDVGLLGEDLSGNGWQIGAELIANIGQRNGIFLDIFGGARFNYAAADNALTLQEAEEYFLVPRFGARVTKQTQQVSFDYALTFEFAMPQVTGVDEVRLNDFGRLDPDAAWQTLKLDGYHSVYLDPLFARWRGEQPGSLAHELVVRGRAQFAFGNRLVPLEQGVAGGFYSVRGYDETVAVGDTVLVGSLEYNFHMPRSFKPDPGREPGRFFGRPFRAVPPEPFSAPDWDLILRAFVDAGRTVNSNAFAFEQNETLLSAGIGVELQLYTNMSARLDWGHVLRDSSNGREKVGDSRLHFGLSLVY